MRYFRRLSIVQQGGVLIAIGVFLLAFSVDTAFAQGKKKNNPNPPCFDNENRYVDCLNGTVTDTVTGLIWLQNANCFGPQNWATANDLAAGLDAKQCGFSDDSTPGDWRLPTKEEWEATIIGQAVVLDCFSPPPVLTGTRGIITGSNLTGCYADEPVPVFSAATVQRFYWSSTAFEADPGAAHLADLDFAFIGVLEKICSGAIGQDCPPPFVWPVRGGQFSPSTVTP